MQDLQLDINWLQDFLAVAETGHFTQAASRRNISQATISRRIQALEKWLGVVLIERGTVPVHLTAEGSRFKKEARITLTHLLNTRASLTETSGGARSMLRVSMPQTIATSHLSKWWTQWSVDLGINLETHIANIADVVSNFITGHSDLLICHQSDHLPVLIDPRHFISHVIETDHLLPVAAIQNDFHHALKHNEALNQIPLLMYSTNGYFSRVVNGIIEQASIQLLGPHSVQTEMADVIGDCAAQGLGIGWIPQSLMRAKFHETLIAIEQPTLTAEMEIVAYAPRHRRSYACDQVWQRLTA